MLYSSDVNEYKALTINCSDDENLKLLASTDDTIKLFKNAHTVPEKVEAWKETYEAKIHGDLIFSKDSTAYQIGVKPLRKRDLIEFNPEDKIVNRFEEILRHNNVSDKENSFNRLIALFICKLVDEITKTEDSEVEFQYKQGADSYETLNDRLQKLHSVGMDNFMHEKVFYVDPEYADRLFSKYRGSDQKKAIAELRDTIRKLKFYSNNDFAFKEIRNEELFRQNGKILVEMVQLFEKYRIVYTSKHQFLGDMFEQLLNKGFKQNEGQFFTPMPITRFIWDCLPVERFIGANYPRIIDYACGAGHFLTEAIEAVNHFAKFDKKNNDWVRDRIYGIEKDYRLARVAKISLFMNGAGEGNIIFGDGLENNPDKGIKPNNFDILVANPPYSIKDFTQHLQLKSNTFTLLEKKLIGRNGGEIETLFVERIGQLLKPKGIAAVILPSSILSNDSASYTGAREIILQNFYVRAITAFGSRTFGATGTNTVVMFLERFNEPPKRVSLFMDSVDAIFSKADLTDWQDGEILNEYTKQIKLGPDIYRQFARRELTLVELEANEYFKMYTNAFAAKNIKAKDNDEYLRKFYEYAHEIEREKLLYFALVYQQSTLIITAPADNKEQKDFLGYDWSNRKGNEGIQHTNPGGKLYKDDDRAATGTLAHAVRQTFFDNTPTLTDDQRKYASIVNTRDMLDFSRTSFNKAMSLTVNSRVTFDTKYELKSIAEIFPVIESGSRPEGGVGQISSGVLSLGGEHIDNVSGYLRLDSPKYVPVDFYNKNEKGRVKWHDILICKDGARTGKVALVRDELSQQPAMLNEHVFLLRSDNIMTQSYVFYILQSPIGQALLKSYVTGSAQGGLNRSNLQQIKIPMPPLTIQQQIVTECETLDNEYNTTRMKIEDYRKRIEEIFNELDVISRTPPRTLATLKLVDTDKFVVSIGKRVLNNQLIKDGKIPVYSANVKEPFGYIDELLITDFSVPSVLWGIDGDWMTNYMPKDVKFYPTDHCGVLRCKTSEVNSRYLVHILEIEGKKRGFSRSYRASIDRIQGITFTVPSRNLQDEAMDKVKAIEAQINEAEKKLESLKGKTAEILKRYL